MRTKRKGGVAVRMLLLLAVALLLIGILAYKERKRDSRMAEGTEETGEETQRETESIWKRETPGDTEEETQVLSGIFLLPVATQSHQIKISMNRKQI